MIPHIYEGARHRRLVNRLVKFERDYDPYGFADDFDDDADAVMYVGRTLSDEPYVIIERLLDIIEDMED